MFLGRPATHEGEPVLPKRVNRGRQTRCRRSMGVACAGTGVVVVSATLPQAVNVPNLISLGRILLVPVFAALFLTGRPTGAVVVFAVAAASDAFDGFLARVLDQRTPLGAILDPLADKLLGLAALVLLVVAGALPFWLLGLSLLRDLVVVGFGLAVRGRLAQITFAPTRISKYATFSLMATVVLALLASLPGAGEGLGPWTTVAAAVAAQCLLVATAQYVNRWRRYL